MLDFFNRETPTWIPMLDFLTQESAPHREHVPLSQLRKPNMHVHI